MRVHPVRASQSGGVPWVWGKPVEAFLHQPKEANSVRRLVMGGDPNGYQKMYMRAYLVTGPGYAVTGRVGVSFAITGSPTLPGSLKRVNDPLCEAYVSLPRVERVSRLAWSTRPVTESKKMPQGRTHSTFDY
jgi:hypothetical protein